MKTQWNFVVNIQQNTAGCALIIYQKWQATLRVKSLHSVEEECKSFLTALHAKLTCTNHVRSVTSFNAVTWKTHVRIVTPLRFEKSALPLT